MRIASMIRAIEKRQAAIAKERDKLDAMIDDLQALKDSCDSAWHDLQSARDHLSEQV